MATYTYEYLSFYTNYFFNRSTKNVIITLHCCLLAICFMKIVHEVQKEVQRKTKIRWPNILLTCLLSWFSILGPIHRPVKTCMNCELLCLTYKFCCCWTDMPIYNGEDSLWYDQSLQILSTVTETLLYLQTKTPTVQRTCQRLDPYMSMTSSRWRVSLRTAATGRQSWDGLTQLHVRTTLMTSLPRQPMIRSLHSWRLQHLLF